MERMRLDKIIADTGLASRKQAAQLIKNGFVIVDGRIALSGADKYDPETTEITVSGKPLGYKKNHYFMMNKPGGYVSATEDQTEKTVLDLLVGRERSLGLFPAGRLDKDAEGLLILTDDGDYVHRIITPAKKVFKKYYVETVGCLSQSDREAFVNGIILKDGLECLPGTLEILEAGEKSTAVVSIREGKYHQVKRMLSALGKPVIYLKRLSIGGLKLDDSLSPGAYRELSPEEVETVFSQTGDDWHIAK